MDPPEFTTGEFVRFWLAERSWFTLSEQRLRAVEANQQENYSGWPICGGYADHDEPVNITLDSPRPAG